MFLTAGVLCKHKYCFPLSVAFGGKTRLEDKTLS